MRPLESIGFVLAILAVFALLGWCRGVRDWYSPLCRARVLLSLRRVAWRVLAIDPAVSGRAAEPVRTAAHAAQRRNWMQLLAATAVTVPSDTDGRLHVCAADVQFAETYGSVCDWHTG